MCIYKHSHSFLNAGEARYSCCNFNNSSLKQPQKPNKTLSQKLKIKGMAMQLSGKMFLDSIPSTEKKRRKERKKSAGD